MSVTTVITVINSIINCWDNIKQQIPRQEVNVKPCEGCRKAKQTHRKCTTPNCRITREILRKKYPIVYGMLRYDVGRKPKEQYPYDPSRHGTRKEVLQSVKEVNILQDLLALTQS